MLPHFTNNYHGLLFIILQLPDTRVDRGKWHIYSARDMPRAIFLIVPDIENDRAFPVDQRDQIRCTDRCPALLAFVDEKCKQQNTNTPTRMSPDLTSAPI